LNVIRPEGNALQALFGIKIRIASAVMAGPGLMNSIQLDSLVAVKNNGRYKGLVAILGFTNPGR